MVLCSASEYFDRLLMSPVNEKQLDEIVIGNIDGETLQSVVECIYTENIDVNEENVESLLAAASFFLFPHLEHKCTEYLTLPGVLNDSNCVGIYDIAMKYAFAPLKESAFAFILDNFLEVIEHDEFLRLSKSGLVELLNTDYIAINSEEEIFNALVKWVRFDLQQRKSDFPELVRMIRLNSLTQTVS